MIAGPQFRRRIEIVPDAGLVVAALKDDFHRMAVRIVHDGTTALLIEADMVRVPWTTCPGALAQLRRTFEGQPLAAFAAAGGKARNCTHLYDLVLLAAAHRADAAACRFDIAVSDPVDGVRVAELRRDGVVVLRWSVDAAGLRGAGIPAGLSLEALTPWIATLDEAAREAVRLLRWGSMLALGRAYSVVEQSAAGKERVGVCYTFQPDRIAHAHRIGAVRDFSESAFPPLAAKTDIDTESRAFFTA